MHNVRNTYQFITITAIEVTLHTVYMSSIEVNAYTSDHIRTHQTCYYLKLYAGETLSNMLGTRLMSVSTLGAIKIHKKCTAHGILSLSIIDILMAFANTHSQMCLLVLQACFTTFVQSIASIAYANVIRDIHSDI